MALGARPQGAKADFFKEQGKAAIVKTNLLSDAQLSSGVTKLFLPRTSVMRILVISLSLTLLTSCALTRNKLLLLEETKVLQLLKRLSH